MDKLYILIGLFFANTILRIILVIYSKKINYLLKVLIETCRLNSKLFDDNDKVISLMLERYSVLSKKLDKEFAKKKGNGDRNVE